MNTQIIYIRNCEKFNLANVGGVKPGPAGPFGV